MNTSIRKLALDAPNTYEQARLTEQQRDLVQRFRDGYPRYSTEIADDLNISTQSASVRLKALVKKGYLTRRECNARTGGIEYEYRIKPELMA